MALTDIVSEGGESSAAARGDIGTLEDILDSRGYCNRLTLAVPTVGQVQTGVVFGPQSSLTGTYVGGGSGVSRGRVTNA